MCECGVRDTFDSRAPSTHTLFATHNSKKIVQNRARTSYIIYAITP